MKIEIEVDMEKEEVRFRRNGCVVTLRELRLEYEDRVRLKFFLMRFNGEMGIDG